MKKQTGGTLIGFVLGFVAGLGVALGVAVYVSKVPVPFVERDVTRPAQEDALEAERNKNWDPNAIFSGKPAPSAPAPDPTGLPAPAAPGSASTTDPGLPASSPGTPPPPAPSADPLGDLVKSRTGGVPSPDSTEVIFFVQTGAFRNPADAEGQRARLVLSGFGARVLEGEQAGGPIHRVRLGPYSTRAEAEAQQSKLAGAGYVTALVRAPRGR